MFHTLFHQWRTCLEMLTDNGELSWALWAWLEARVQPQERVTQILNFFPIYYLTRHNEKLILLSLCLHIRCKYFPTQFINKI